MRLRFFAFLFVSDLGSRFGILHESTAPPLILQLILLLYFLGYFGSVDHTLVVVYKGVPCVEELVHEFFGADVFVFNSLGIKVGPQFVKVFYFTASPVIAEFQERGDLEGVVVETEHSQIDGGLVVPQHRDLLRYTCADEVGSFV